jgi:secreted trypsin-like serine protease
MALGCGDAGRRQLDIAWAPIVNGEITEDYPAVIALYMKGSVAGAGSLCSGTIINDEWVLTAAHCPLTAEDAGGFSEEYSTIFVGDDFLSSESLELSFDEWYAHPGYNGVSEDVAVFHLAEPSPVEGIPINRYGFDETLAGESCLFVGFGTNEDGTVDGLKRETEIEVTGVLPTVFYYYDSYTMTDHGDSGGPALYDFGEGQRVVGVTSWGFADYGVSTRPDDVADWIDDYTGGDSPVWTDDDDDTTGDDDDSAVGDDDTAGDDDDDNGGDGCSCSAAGGSSRCLPALLVLAAATILLARRPRTRA